MISRFFKKKAPVKKSPKKKVKKMMPSRKAAPRKKAGDPTPKILTAEGWKRLMMRKYGKTKE